MQENTSKHTYIVTIDKASLTEAKKNKEGEVAFFIRSFIKIFQIEDEEIFTFPQGAYIKKTIEN